MKNYQYLIDELDDNLYEEEFNYKVKTIKEKQKKELHRKNVKEKKDKHKKLLKNKKDNEII